MGIFDSFKFRLILIAIFFLLGVTQTARSDTKLNEIISNLYGGDGIVLLGNFTIIEHSADFQEDSLEELAELATLVSEIRLPVPSSQAGFTYEFDPVTNEFVQTGRSLGPIFAQRAETVGKNKFNFAIALSHVDFSEFEGDDLDNLKVVFRHEDEPPAGRNAPCIGAPFPNCYTFERDEIDVDLDITIRSQILTLLGSYGFTENFEAGLVIPIIRNYIKVRAKARLRNHPSVALSPVGSVHSFAPTGTISVAPSGSIADGANDTSTGTEIGVGDILLRAKYRWYDSPDLQLAGALEVRLPTGDEDELMGLPRVGVRPILIASGEFPVGEGTVSPHVNLSYSINSGARKQDQFGYAVGVEYGQPLYGDYITVAADLLGSHETTKKDGIGDDILDFSIGLKWNFDAQNLAFINVIVPINEGGLRPEAVPTVGYQLVF